MNTYYIYTDGSPFKGKGGSGRLGIGGVLVDPDGQGVYGKELQNFSQEILPEYIKVHYDTTDCSNPTMELYAVLFALKEFKGSYTKNDLIIIRADYMGVSEWLKGNWKINKPYIRKIKDQIYEIIKKENLNIKFEWVRGHQKAGTAEAHWNDRVDKLSKGIV